MVPWMMIAICVPYVIPIIQDTINKIWPMPQRNVEEYVGYPLNQGYGVDPGLYPGQGGYPAGYPWYPPTYHFGQMYPPSPAFPSGHSFYSGYAPTNFGYATGQAARSVPDYRPGYMHAYPDTDINPMEYYYTFAHDERSGDKSSKMSRSTATDDPDVIAYARTLGIEPDEDEDLLWVAAEELTKKRSKKTGGHSTYAQGTVEIPGARRAEWKEEGEFTKIINADVRTSADIDRDRFVEEHHVP
eukprot:gnl/MRDRNA2_/MRDRNA2_148437_c0_seq1.p1 gnl/MRDRNA2_/MRDRNA2_148437_c0~~gnl/MRDRNA2_/MRDRNA2_148437_c0_seq1.p1  ORF type:complete len:243 (+),score=38.97 gnl/MRDRNA2_/MRDRNA2_148437_c0_seq1:63-791(+)